MARRLRRNADSFCFRGICKIGVGNVWRFGTKNTQIFSVSAESARSAWEMCVVFGTQITQIVTVSAESARSAWEMCRVLARRLRRLFCFCGICKIGVENCQDSCYRHLLSKLCDSLIIILCGCHLTKTGMFPNSLYAIGGCWGLSFYILVTFCPLTICP